MGQFSRAWFALFTALFCAPVGGLDDALAYTPTLSQSGKQVKRKNAPKLMLAGNPVNANAITESEVFNAVVRSLQRWKVASEGAADFDYWQGTDPSIYEPNSAYNGLSSLYFASNARGEAPISSNVLGLTQVWYKSESGEILESDIILNDLHYRFTTNPADTTGFGSGNDNRGRYRKVYIENVLTHEIGHAFGLSHSGSLQSSMLFMESPEQAFLACDEQAGIHAVYSERIRTRGDRGTIQGQVVSSQGDPVFGAQVAAISRRRGTVMASALTDRNGNYSLQGLEPGTYFLMAEPFYAGAGALPAFYGGINHAICGRGEIFSRTLLVAGGSNELAPVQVRPGSSALAPAIQVRCQNGGAAVVASTETSATTPVIFDGSRGDKGFGVTDRFGSTGRIRFELKDVSGTIEIHSLAYSLYSPVHATLRLLDSWGQVVQAQSAMTVYQGVSGYVNYDSALIARELPKGDYTLEVSGSGLSRSFYPAGPVSVDAVPFVVITGSVNEPAPSLASKIPFNARCRMDENFAAYTSPPGNPPRSSIEEDSEFIGFCGRMSQMNDADGSGDGPSSPGAGALISWFLPWVFMLLAARIMRIRAASSGMPARHGSVA